MNELPPENVTPLNPPVPDVAPAPKVANAEEAERIVQAQLDQAGKRHEQEMKVLRLRLSIQAAPAFAGHPVASIATMSLELVDTLLKRVGLE